MQYENPIIRWHEDVFYVTANGPTGKCFTGTVWGLYAACTAPTGSREDWQVAHCRRLTAKNVTFSL